MLSWMVYSLCFKRGDVQYARVSKSLQASASPKKVHAAYVM